MTPELKGKLPCQNYGHHCLNTTVAECDLGNGRGVKLYCRSCIENSSCDCDIDDCEVDDTLVFCKREWELQGK